LFCASFSSITTGGRESWSFVENPNQKGLFKLLKVTINLKEKEYFENLDYCEKWHLSREGQVYAYLSNKARTCVYRSGRKPATFSDVADQLPERDKVQIEILSVLGDLYAFHHGQQYMYLAKYKTAAGWDIDDSVWTSKEYHRFYLSENSDGCVYGGHGMANKEVVLDRFHKPVNTTEGLKKNVEKTLLSVGSFLGTSYQVKNESQMIYSYDSPQYRLIWFGVISTSHIYENLDIVRNEVYGTSKGKQIKLVNSAKLPTFEFNPFPYLINGLLLFLLLFRTVTRPLFTHKKGLLLIALATSVYLNAQIYPMEEIKKDLNDQQIQLLKEKKEQFKRDRKETTNTGNLIHSITGRIYRSITHFTTDFLWSVWLDSCHIEAWNFWVVGIIFLNNKNVPPKSMIYVIIFGKAVMMYVSTEKNL
jgi:hypothetical protein